MGLQNRTKTLSSLSRELLAEGESERADFKRSPDGVSAEDLVAFANSVAGGQILVGVDEQTTGSGQIGVVRGCDVGDASILQIINKAVSCFPPISIDIFVENVNTKPILRIAVPSSETKPHCTSKGIYCSRDGSRNRPLHPHELLNIFLEKEARVFAERFESTAGRITEELADLEDTLDRSIKSMADQLGWADYKLGDTESLLGTIVAYTRQLRDETGDISSRLRSLFNQDKRQDPIRVREQKALTKQTIEEIEKREDLLRHVVAGGTLTITAQGKAALELTEDDVRSAVNEAIEVVRTKEDLKAYAVVCKSPAQCTTADLNGFVAVHSKGPDVMDGTRSRIENAHRIGYIIYKGTVVGTAALEKPKLPYREQVFKNAKSSASPKEYPYELDWVSCSRSIEGRGS